MLAANLQALMERSLDLKSQGAVGKRTGIDQTTIGRILREENQPRLDQLDKLAKAFHLSPQEMLTPDMGAASSSADALRLLALYRQLPPASQEALLMEAERLLEAGPWSREALWVARDVQRLAVEERPAVYNRIQDVLVNPEEEAAADDHQGSAFRRSAPSPSAPAEPKPKRRPARSR